MTRANSEIWKLDTSEMTVDELEAYKKELQRLAELERKRWWRNIRLIIYALVLVLIVVGIASIPGFIRAQQGPVILREPDLKAEQEEGPGGECGNYVERTSDHSFDLYLGRNNSEWDYDWDDWDDMWDGYLRIKGTITTDPEPLNKQGKSSVSFSDGTTGEVWFEKGHAYQNVFLKIRYKGNVYGFPWYSLNRYNELKKK